jgi:hypothetical protein
MLLSGGKKKQKRNQNKEGVMKDYLFGLGVMIVAGRDHKVSHKYSRFYDDA